jgi:galactokinase
MKAACRVHGGGFAGTIQAYIPVDALEDYRTRMEALFGTGALSQLRIRQEGAIEIR